MAESCKIVIDGYPGKRWYCVFDQDKISSVNGENSVSIVGDELSYDVFTAVVLHQSTQTQDLLNLPCGTEVAFYVNDSIFGKYYSKSVEFLGKNQYKIKCVSAVGLLDSKTHRGNVYNGVTFKSVLEDIFGENIATPLPAGYERLIYLATTNRASIGSRNVPSEFDIDFSFNKASADARDAVELVFSYGSSSKTMLIEYAELGVRVYISGSSKVYYRCNKGMHSINIHVSGNSLSISVDGESKYTNQSEFSANISSVSISVGERMNTSDGFSYLCIHNGFNKYAELIPCINLSNSYKGIYETVDESFTVATNPSYIDVYRKISEFIKDVIIADDLSETLVYGWLPYDTQRKNLSKLISASNSAIIKDDLGRKMLTFISDSFPTDIPSSEVYVGGSITCDNPVSLVQVTEHAYYESSDIEEETLFDNSDDLTSVSKKLVLFSNAPIQLSTITANGITLDEVGVNYAVVSGIGTVVGKPYRHTTHVVEKENSTDREEHVVSCDDNTLVSVLNSDSFSQKLLTYYKDARSTKNSIYTTNQRCGVKYRFTNASGSIITAFLMKMSYNLSSFLKSNCEYISNYVPPSVLPYSHSVILTDSSGTWEVPTGVTSIKVILIGGGSGGSGGAGGETGGRGSNSSGSSSVSVGGDGGDGGEGGQGGYGGKVLEISISNNLLQSYQYTCGEGGEGGDGSSGPSHSSGYAGGHTTFGMYSSANGTIYESGYTDILSGTTYASQGGVGVDGGKGGKGGKAFRQSTSSATMYDAKGEGGEDVSFEGQTYRGGNAYYDECTKILYDYKYGSPTSGGGGAAVGAAGANGGNTVNVQDTITSTLRKLVNQSNYGGAGASAEARTQNSVRGGGGHGGHGGGGGGGGAAGLVSDNTYSGFNLRFITEGYPSGGGAFGGNGGYGGDGGQGGDGCIIIYY